MDVSAYNVALRTLRKSTAKFTWVESTPEEYQRILHNLSKCLNGNNFDIPSCANVLRSTSQNSGSYFPILIGGDSAYNSLAAIQGYVDSGATHTFITQPAVDLILQRQDPQDPSLKLIRNNKPIECHISADGSLTTPITHFGVIHGRCLWQEGQFIMIDQQVIVIQG